MSISYPTPPIFVRLETKDVRLLDLQKRVDKISLIQIWVTRGASLLERYMKLLDKINEEKDGIQKGILIEEMDICFMSSVSYFLRCFLDQKGSYSLEIKNITSDNSIRETFNTLMNLRNDEYVHWKGARSKANVYYSFSALKNNQVEFARNCEMHFEESVGPENNAAEIRTLFETTMQFIERQRGQDLQKMNHRLAQADAWTETQIFNDKNEPIMIKT